MVEIAKLRAANEKNKAKTAASSFAQISDSPDDGFAKVEAKLKALQEKIKADTAKFEQEAKASPSSFAEISATAAQNLNAAADSWSLEHTFAPMDALEQKFSQLQDRMQAQTRKFEAQAKQDALIEQQAMHGRVTASSLLQTSENPDDGFAKVEAKLK